MKDIYVVVFQRERAKGVFASELVRMLPQFANQDVDIFDVFCDSFGFDSSDLVPLWRRKLEETSDEKINKYLEQSFSRLRLGGFLVPSTVAQFMGISVNELEQVLSNLNTQERVIEISYPNPIDRSIALKDVELQADLLWDIEAVVHPKNRSPWWWWKAEPYQGEFE